MDANDITDTIDSALTALRSGLHPLGYLSHAELSLSEHAKRYLGSLAYRNKVNVASIECLAHWKSFTAQQFGQSLKKRKSEQTTQDIYAEICARAARASGDPVDDQAFNKKSDWTALFKHIEDIEHYAYKLAPDISVVSRLSQIDITDTEQTSMFDVSFIEQSHG